MSPKTLEICYFCVVRKGFFKAVQRLFIAPWHRSSLTQQFSQECPLWKSACGCWRCAYRCWTTARCPRLSPGSTISSLLALCTSAARCWVSCNFGLQRSFSHNRHSEHSCWCQRHTSGGRWAHRWAAGATWSCWPRAATCWPMLKHCSNAAAWSMLFALFLWKRLWLVKEEKQGSIAKFQGVKSALCWNFGS